MLATPDYGTLGPDSDFAKNTNSSNPAGARRVGKTGSKSSTVPNVRAFSVLAALAGLLAALAVTVSLRPGTLLTRSRDLVSRTRNGDTNAFPAYELDRQEPQKQAELLLTSAVGRSPGATDEIQRRLYRWRGKLSLDPQLTQLTTAALNSDDTKVRISAVDVQLAAYGLESNAATVQTLISRAASAEHPEKIWALWALGLLGNRGVESDRVVQVLARHLEGTLRDPDDDSRRWAVEGLALVGTDATIAPLLKALHDDASPLVRERAACGLAESGMLTHQQRMSAVPQLISDLDDPALDAQTRTWAFQALTEITRERLPNDASAWRSWQRNSLPID